MSTLEVTYLNGHYWMLHHPLEVLTDTVGKVVVPAGFVTDFNSIPRFFWRVAPPIEYGVAAVLHDFLYREDARPLVTREQADRTHREMMQRAGASWLRQATYYQGLRCFAGPSFQRKEVAWRPANIDRLLTDWAARNSATP